jgi:glycosyltransferase involved in cell wall biosynthesis
VKKSLLFIHRNQFGYQAGYYYYCKYLKDHFDISFVCQDAGLNRIELEGVKVIYVQVKGNKLTAYFRWLKFLIRLIRKNKYNIVFTAFIKFVFLLPILLRNQKFVLDIRTGSLAKSKIKNYIQNRAVQLQASFFKYKTILSEGLIGRLKLKNCHIIPLGSDKISDTVKKLDIISMLYVGTFRGRNFHETIEGLYLFLEKNKQFRQKLTYDIIGFGIEEEEKAVINAIKQFHLEDVVTFHGRKNHIELKPFFDACNIGICWVPITDYFKFQPPTKIFEYVLSGMVCIATNTFENSRLIDHRNGILCDDNPPAFAGALESVIQNFKQEQFLYLKDTLENYSWENIVKFNMLNYLNGITN